MKTRMFKNDLVLDVNIGKEKALHDLLVVLRFLPSFSMS